MVTLREAGGIYKVPSIGDFWTLGYESNWMKSCDFTKLQIRDINYARVTSNESLGHLSHY